MDKAFLNLLTNHMAIKLNVLDSFMEDGIGSYACTMQINYHNIKVRGF